MLATPLQVGPVPLRTNVLLAPIAGYCDLAWRATVRGFGGCGLACTDLLSPQGLLRGTATSLDLAQTNEADRPIGMQLYGSDPSIMADGARWAADHGATVVDINMGCPVDKVCKKDGGSKLMCDIGRAAAIARAARAALPDAVPLTAKMRLGWTGEDADANVAGALACELIDAGVCMITVHGRTTEQRFKGECDRGGIRRVVERVREAAPGVPVIGNGDIRSGEDCVRMIEDTGCAGVMIGRGALSRPWLLRDCWEAQLARSRGEGFESVPPSQTRIAGTILEYFERMIENRDERYAMFKIRSRISWLVKPLNSRRSSARPLQDAVRASESAPEVRDAIRRYLAGELRWEKPALAV